MAAATPGIVAIGSLCGLCRDQFTGRERLRASKDALAESFDPTILAGDYRIPCCTTSAAKSRMTVDPSMLQL